MAMIKQNNIEIGDKILPEITCNQIVYYPFSYTIEQILVKKKQPIKKLKENGYNNYIVKLCVDYGFKGGGLQNTYCISKEGLVILLNSSYIGGLTIEQKKSMNLLLDYFGMDLINEKPRFINNYDYEDSDEYDEFIKDCITETLKLDGSLEWQLCKDCERYYPLHTNFFVFNTRDENYQTYCKNCKNTNLRHRFVHPNNYLNNIYNQYGEDVYVLYKNHDVISIYNHFIQNNLNTFPSIINNKNDYIIILKYLHENQQLDKDNITFSYLINNHNLRYVKEYFNIEDIYVLLFGEHPKKYPWHYKKYFPPKLSMSRAREIFDNYLKENHIVIKDVYKFNYGYIISKSKLRQFDSDILQFIMDYHYNKYPPYKFSINAINYWKNKKNRVSALKYLIEEDMKLELEKIPLYLTITSVRSIGTTTMYNVLKNYYSSLYEWVNEVYPDIFDPKDFDINYMRNEFDSIDEQTINDILKDNLENVLYNPKHTEHTIKLLGKIPDWLIFTTNGVIIVEYFGLWAKKRGMYNSRTRDYIISSKDKIEKYKTLQGYSFLYIFPEDLDNNYEGLYSKIEKVKNNKILNKIG